MNTGQRVGVAFGVTAVSILIGYGMFKIYRLRKKSVENTRIERNKRGTNNQQVRRRSTHRGSRRRDEREHAPEQAQQIHGAGVDDIVELGPVPRGDGHDAPEAVAEHASVVESEEESVRSDRANVGVSELHGDPRPPSSVSSTHVDDESNVDYGYNGIDRENGDNMPAVAEEGDERALTAGGDRAGRNRQRVGFDRNTTILGGVASSSASSEISEPTTHNAGQDRQIGQNDWRAAAEIGRRRQASADRIRRERR